MHVAEFTLHAKPGHFEEVAQMYSEFAESFLRHQPALQMVLVVGDEASGVVRGLGVFNDREDADSVNSNPEFASFNDRVSPLLAMPSERIELRLLHRFTR